MEALLAHLLAGTHGVVAYLLVFGILVLCGLGLPLPEDVSLILGGYLAYSGAVHLTYMVITGFVGILVGDSIIFSAGRRLGRNINADSWIGRHVTPERLARVEKLFARWGQKIVMAARFLPGVRAAVFFTAGTSGMAYWRFILFDGLAACLSAPLFIICGQRFGGEITHFIHMARRAQGMVFATVLVLVVAYFLVQRRRLRVEAAEAEAEAEATTASVEQPVTPAAAPALVESTSPTIEPSSPRPGLRVVK